MLDSAYLCSCNTIITWLIRPALREKKITFTEPYKEGHMSEEGYCEWQDQMLDLFCGPQNPTQQFLVDGQFSQKVAAHSELITVITKTLIVITQDLALEIT